MLLSLVGCRMALAYDTISNVGSISYTNVNGSDYKETTTGSVNVLIYSGPLMSIAKTSLNMRTGEQGSNTAAISCVPGDTVQMDLFSHNVGDSYAFNITIVDTFPSRIGDPASNSMSYVPGSETCAINGSTIADSISWCTDAAHTWSAWQTYSDTLSRTIGSNCTGIRWKWNVVPSNDVDSSGSWIRMRYQWYRNGN